MLGNWITWHDVRRLCRRLPRHLATLARRASVSARDRTVETWSRPMRNDQWWSVPAILRRWNELVTGDASVHHTRWIADRFLAPAASTKEGKGREGKGREGKESGDLVGLSLGCGEGARELAWARTGCFRELTGIDVTPAAIAAGRRAADAAGLADVVRFEVGDLSDPSVLADRRYDVIIGEHSVHHLSPLRSILTRLRERLRPGGLFILDEFVGPSHFQWSDAQLEVVNGLLPLLPERLRRQSDGDVKHREHRPSRLWMQLNDPSEAIESSAILPTMDSLFTPRMLRPYGGTVLHLLLARIGHHFHGDDPEAMAWLQLFCSIEDRLLASGQLPSDFAVGVWRRE